MKRNIFIWGSMLQKRSIETFEKSFLFCCEFEMILWCKEQVSFDQLLKSVPFDSKGSDHEKVIEFRNKFRIIPAP